MKLYRCNKTVLSFRPKGASFVNAYTANTVDAPQNVFVDLQGKIVALVHQHKISEDEVHVILETPFVDRLTGHLRQYLSLSETQVRSLDLQKIFWDLETHRLIVTDKALEAGVSEEEYLLYRIQHGVPVQGIDFDQEMVLNVAGEGLISYTKGCYLGQEIVARVHYRGKPPRRLELRAENECTEEEKARMTSKVFDPAAGEFMGFVLVDL